MWWWDGMKWVPATQAPQQMQPMVPPSYYSMPPPATFNWAPSPGLRVFLIVFLVLQALVFGLFLAAGVIAFATGTADPSSVVFLVVVLVLFALPAIALVGVLRRAAWARWVSLAAGIASTLTCLGSVLGIPILVSAARAPLGKPRAS